MLGDAGEHYALSQFTFAGWPCAKMPDNWPGYDLAVETGQGLTRISVKTRSESEGWRTSRFFTFDERLECEWLVLVFKANAGPPRAWVIPKGVACREASKSGPARKDPYMRDVSWQKLTKGALVAFENNWTLIAAPVVMKAPIESE
jgi:hypothetical protein